MRLTDGRIFVDANPDEHPLALWWKKW